MSEVRNAHGFPIPSLAPMAFNSITSITSIKELRKYLDYVPNSWHIKPLEIKVQIYDNDTTYLSISHVDV